MKSFVDAVVERSKIESVARSATLRFGPVTDVIGTSVMVELEGVTVGPLPVLKGVVPETGDQAWMLAQNSVLVVIGVSSGENFWTQTVTTANVALTNPVGRFSATTQEDANILFVAEIDRRVGGDGVTDMVYLTQEEFDQITPDPQTVYVVKE